MKIGQQVRQWRIHTRPAGRRVAQRVLAVRLHHYPLANGTDTKILTVTPEGVGPLTDGDEVSVTVELVGTLTNRVVIGD